MWGDLQLLDEFPLRIGRALEVDQCVGGMEVQAGDRPAAGPFQFRNRLFEERKRFRVVPLFGEEPGLDVGGQRELRVALSRESGLAAGTLGIVARERDSRQQLVRGRARSGVALASHADGELRMGTRVVQPSNLEHRTGRPEIAGRARRLELDHVRVGLDRLVVALRQHRKRRHLFPRIHDGRILIEDPMEQRDRLDPLPVDGEIDGLPVGLENRVSVLGIGQPGGGRRRHGGPSARRSRAPAGVRAPPPTLFPARRSSRP